HDINKTRFLTYTVHLSFSFYCSGYHRDLHSFPTRRSSDLPTHYCIALQPICDAKMQHRADEMLYRAAPDSLHAQIDCGLTATVRACSTAFYEIGLRTPAGDRLLLSNAPRDTSAEPALRPPSAARVRSAGMSA